MWGYRVPSRGNFEALRHNYHWRWIIHLDLPSSHSCSNPPLHTHGKQPNTIDVFSWGTVDMCPVLAYISKEQVYGGVYKDSKDTFDVPEFAACFNTTTKGLKLKHLFFQMEYASSST